MTADQLARNEATATAAKFVIRSAIDLQVAQGSMQRLPLMSDLSVIDRTSVMTMLSELASNIVKYAEEGYVSIERVESKGAVQIRLTAEDKGPGIKDISVALQDSTSTAGTLGLGLPSVKRMSDHFGITNTERGLQVVAEKWVSAEAETRALSKLAFQMSELIGVQGGVSGPFDYAVGRKGFGGSRFVGDLALMAPAGGQWLIAIIDATGHGERAFKTASLAASTIVSNAQADLIHLLYQTHEALALTEGAAIGLLLIQPESGQFTYAGIGNTRVETIGNSPWRGVSTPGIVGQRMREPFLQESVLARDDLLSLSSDGIDEFDVGNLLSKHRMLGLKETARKVMTQHAAHHDDACCLLLRRAS